MDEWRIEKEEIVKTARRYKRTKKEHKFGFVYFLIEDNEIVYVGQSINVDSRVSEHRLNKVFSKIKWIRVDVNELDIAETYYILSLRPVYNVNMGKRTTIDKVSQEYGLPPFYGRNKKPHLVSPSAFFRYSKARGIKDSVTKKWIDSFGLNIKDWICFIEWTKRRPEKIEEYFIDRYAEIIKRRRPQPNEAQDHAGGIRDAQTSSQ